MARHAKANIFLERSLKSAFDFFKEAIFSEEIAKYSGLLQSADPRLKAIALLATLILVCFINDPLLLAALYLISILLAVASRIDLLFFIKRVWFFIPIFTLFIAIPAIFMQGLFSAVLFVIRVTTCVSFVILVTITTRHNQLLKTLKSFGVPNIFIQVFDMTYIYIFLFVKVFEEMHLSLKSRLIKALDAKRARSWAASRIGYLFKRSLKMSEEVYLAMIARGYTGEVKRYDK